MKKLLKFFREILSTLSAILFFLFRFVNPKYFNELYFAVKEGYCRARLKKLGKWSRIGKNVRLKIPENIEIGDNARIENLVSLESGKIGKGIKIGDNARIRQGCVFFTGEHETSLISIGNDVYVNNNCCFYGCGGIEIGNNVLIAPGAVITSYQHSYKDKNRLIIEQTPIMKKIVIEDDTWIGSNAVICPGVKIGKGSVIGAGAVVVKDVPEYSVAVGVPSKVIKKRA